jgi:hypothetical protein
VPTTEVSTNVTSFETQNVYNHNLKISLKIGTKTDFMIYSTIFTICTIDIKQFCIYSIQFIYIVYAVNAEYICICVLLRNVLRTKNLSIYSSNGWCL